MFSWLSLTSGLFDRLRINFLSSIEARQGLNTIRFFYERLLTHSTDFVRWIWRSHPRRQRDFPEDHGAGTEPRPLAQPALVDEDDRPLLAEGFF
jgi:hypothetical protein